MRVLVTYDVATATPKGRKRLRRVARACQDYGQRVQFSVFECEVGDVEWALLRARLLTEYDTKEDSLRFYFLDQTAVGRTEHHGVRAPWKPEGPLIV